MLDMMRCGRAGAPPQVLVVAATGASMSNADVLDTGFRSALRRKVEQIRLY